MKYDEDAGPSRDSETEEERSVSSKDQLTYRQTIQQIVNRCFFSMGTMTFPRHVKALKTALYFQIPGLPFKSKIDEIEQDLSETRSEKLRTLKKRMGRNFYGNAEQAKIKIQMGQWFWEKKLESLLDLLSQHDALMRAKQFVESGDMYPTDLLEEGEENKHDGIN